MIQFGKYPIAISFVIVQVFYQNILGSRKMVAMGIVNKCIKMYQTVFAQAIKFSFTQKFLCYKAGAYLVALTIANITHFTDKTGIASGANF